jgi:small multidrug resistance pump
VPYLFLTFAVVTNMVGHVMFKVGANAGLDGGLLRSLLSVPTFVGFAAYAASAVLYVGALRSLPLSVAMPTMVIGYVGATIVAGLLWNEPIGLRHAGALALIASAMVLLHR